MIAVSFTGTAWHGRRHGLRQPRSSEELPVIGESIMNAGTQITIAGDLGHVGGT
jgi:hypothetical protein